MAARVICWQPVWNARFPGIGMERLVLQEGPQEGWAESVILGMTEGGVSFRVDYRLEWDAAWFLRKAAIERRMGATCQSLELAHNGAGNWRDGSGAALPHLAGCIDIDIWPTPFTNTFPIRRAPPAAPDSRAEYAMAWVDAVSGPEITVKPMRQGYTLLRDGRYLYENLDGNFRAHLPVDGDGLVLDYEGVFRRVPATAEAP
ncbi:hypothetical protein A8950_1771 [Dongia mobilis]|uniref:Glycolipid-binding protein n=1 Tax=Dongia mobilis TaxID=578943 RepID=A0A4R6WR71_9PROT|nr:putative glycolipid-binding domain-containing protein [Dongia mobilis]TDQ81951.1 hypothetical protein A8950_1771 [Dongia mobilis]